MREWLDNLENRTQKFATDVVKFAITLERVPGCWDAARQLARAAASVGANHRAARRSGSDRWLLAKLLIVNEEADECVYWFEMVERAGAEFGPEGRALLRESRELRAIFGKSVATMRKRVVAKLKGRRSA